MDRIVKNERGHLYIATSDAQWKTRYAAWQKAFTEMERETVYTTVPCPVPQKHIMFDKPRTLGYEPVNF